MKRTIAIWSILLFSFLEINAQINLEHTFNTNDKIMLNFSTQTQIMYYYVDELNIYFYNENFTLYKTIGIPIQNDYGLSSISYYSTNLFNNDNYIEFCCYYLKDDFTDSKIIIYNENLSVLETYNSSLISCIYSTKNNGCRMNILRYTNFPYNYVIDVYSLPGTYTTIDESDQVDQLHSPFPNPAIDEILIPYKINENETTEMLILDSSGKVIDSYKIGGHFNKIRLNTSFYLPGIYFYKYNSVCNKFLVQ